MKPLLHSLLLFSFTVFSQTGQKDVQVEYQAFYAYDSPMKMNATLYISGNASVYREKLSTKEPWVERSTPEIIARDKRFATGYVPEDYYMRTDRYKKEVLFYDYVMSNKFLVRDAYDELQLQITSETKTVAGLTCVKATTDFRGRQWIAWFTPDIPLAFGPWKLNGLPGLILEAADSTNKFIMQAVKVEYRKDEIEILAKDFMKLMPAKNNNKPITYQQFLKDNEEGLDNLGADRDLTKEAAASGAAFGVTNVTVGKPVAPPRSGMELVYEWEKQ